MVGEAPEDWVELYRSALMELDLALISQKIEAADFAIQHRLHQLLLQRNHSQEHQELEDALRNLRSLRRQIK